MARTNVVAKVNQYPPYPTSVHAAATSLESLDEGPYEGAEDDKRKSISQEKLKHSTDDHEQTSHEVVGTNRRDPVPASTPPSHEVAAERRERKQEAEQSLGKISNWGVAFHKSCCRGCPTRGVGLAKVLRRSPFTLFCGER